MLPCLQSSEEGVILALFVQPRASKNQILGLVGEELKVRLTSPPVDGAANKACCAYLAKLFGVPKGAAAIISGDKSRHKRVFLRGVSLEEAQKVIGDQF